MNSTAAEIFCTVRGSIINYDNMNPSPQITGLMGIRSENLGGICLAPEEKIFTTITSESKVKIIDIYTVPIKAAGSSSNSNLLFLV